MKEAVEEAGSQEEAVTIEGRHQEITPDHHLIEAIDETHALRPDEEAHLQEMVIAMRHEEIETSTFPVRD